MKNLKVKLIGFLLLTFVMVSCGSDEPIAITPPLNEVLENLNNGIMEGKLSENYTLDPTIQYSLRGAFIIENNGILTIPAGTIITADSGGTEVYIAVLQGGEININGNAGNPVVMSSATGSPGDWGGLTLCGNASTTAGVNASAEVGGFIYGGTDDVDSSGIIRYLQIVGTGAQINPESQYNGISFYGVGSGTLVDHVAIINGSDDGVEFFGGTVAVSNLYLENNIDSSVFSFDQNLNLLIDQADLCITRAGASSLAEISLSRKPFIAIPLPSSKDNHQLENANYYKNKGCCWVIDQINFDKIKFEDLLLNILNNKNEILLKKNNLEKLNFQNTWNNVNQNLLNIINEN